MVLPGGTTESSAMTSLPIDPALCNEAEFDYYVSDFDMKVCIELMISYYYYGNKPNAIQYQNTHVSWALMS